MKTAFLLSTLLVGAQSFAPVARRSASSALAGAVPEDQLSESQKEIKGIQEKWTEVRHLTKEQAKEQLEGEWLEAHNRFFEMYDDDMERMIEIVTKLEKSIEQPQIAKKTKGQRRRDAFARKEAYADLRAANNLASRKAVV